MCVRAATERASKEDVLLLYINKWQRHIAQSRESLAQLLQVPDASSLQRALQAAWPFTDQVKPCQLSKRTGCDTPGCCYIPAQFEILGLQHTPDLGVCVGGFDLSQSSVSMALLHWRDVLTLAVLLVVW